MATKDDILGSEDLRSVVVPTPEWPKCPEVEIREMTAAIRAEVTMLGAADPDDATRARRQQARAVAASAWGKDGAPIFDFKDNAEVDRLAAKSARAVLRLFLVAEKIAFLGQSEIDRILGKSAGGETSSPSSPSPSA